MAAAPAALVMDPGAFNPTHKVPSSVHDSFEKIIGEDAPEQAKASVIILKYVDTLFQDPRLSEDELPGDVSYIICRLVSGLMSSKLRVREGYYTTLQALLQLHPSTVTLTFSTVMEKYCGKKALHGATKEQLWGELLAYGALIRSGQAHYHSEMRLKMISRLFQITKTQTALNIIAAQFLVNLIEKCEGAVVYKDISDRLEKDVSAPIKELSPCLLWLRLVLLKTHKDNPPVWLTSTLNPKNYPAIGHIVMQTTANVPKVHPLLEYVVFSLASDDRATESSLVKFWQDQLAPSLKQLSTDKIQFLFSALQLILPKLKKGSEVDAVFSASLVTLLLSTVSLHDKDLSMSARGLASALLQLVTANQGEDSDVQLAVVKKLVIPPGSVRFDKLTGTKLLTQMKSRFTVKTIKGFAEILNMIMRKQIKKVKPADQSFAACTLRNLMMHPRVSSADHLTWKTHQAIALMKMAFFTQGEPDLLQDFRNAFFKALALLTGRVQEYKIVLLNIVSVASEELRLCETSGSSPLNEEAKRLWSHVDNNLTLLQNRKKASTSNQVFQVLYGQMALHLFIDPVEAADIIDELDACQKKALKEENAEGEENISKAEALEEPHWVEVVTELLLSLLTHEEGFFRSMAKDVFELICPYITPLAITIITDVFDPAKIPKLISKEENRIEKMDEEDEDMEAENEEEEETKEKEEQGEDDDDDDDDDSESDSSDDDDDEDLGDDDGDGADDNMEKDKTFKIKRISNLKENLYAVLGNVDVDVDMDSVPEDELNKLDKQLSAVFSQHRKSRMKKKKGNMEKLLKDERSLMVFQLRACDLIDVYIKVARNMDVFLSLVNPLLVAFQTADQDQRLNDLQKRVKRSIGLVGKPKKFETHGDATIDGVIEILNTFITTAYEMPQTCSDVVRDLYQFLLRCGSQLLGEESHKQDNPLIIAYADHLETFFSRKTCSVKLDVFLAPCSLDIGGLWTIVEFAMKYAFDPKVKVYRQSQAFEVLKKLYQNKALLTQGNEDDMTRIEGELCQKIVDALNRLQLLESVNGSYMLSLFNLLVLIHKSNTKTGLHKSFNWEKIKVAVAAVHQQATRKTKNSFRKPYKYLRAKLKLAVPITDQNNLPKQNAETKITASQEECVNEDESVNDCKEENKNEKQIGNAKKCKKIKKKKKMQNKHLEESEEKTLQASAEESVGKKSIKRERSSSPHQNLKRKNV